MVATAPTAARFCVVSEAHNQAEETVVHQAYDTAQYNQMPALQQEWPKKTSFIVETYCVV
jgi:hypothetical protein